MNDQLTLGKINSLVPHNTGLFPMSRDFAINISCDNTKCICHGYDGCAVPSNCCIDSNGCCKWYLKQLEKEENKDVDS
jgi:hypothetical protein